MPKLYSFTLSVVAFTALSTASHAKENCTLKTIALLTAREDFQVESEARKLRKMIAPGAKAEVIFGLTHDDLWSAERMNTFVKLKYGVEQLNARGKEELKLEITNSEIEIEPTRKLYVAAVRGSPSDLLELA